MLARKALAAHQAENARVWADLTCSPVRDNRRCAICVFTAPTAVHRNGCSSIRHSGSGSTLDWFPKQTGVIKLQIEGYDVERETKVVETPFYFIERWRKGEEAGENRMIYEVSRGTMGANGGEGTDPPYRR
ncbi:hypothetical protein [Paenibacillus piri]|uniref:Uncharacterized protein n=1 Tax=Paenibacillus piri TaxID=2547395 RepID=A0A4R5KID4_9BACL|nr:hypothetical protein [Paenibacillus piri]TDF95146.1 hypothetical protein E1757_21690 [Paenibacillus piri]